jgi:hypothetical protein
MAVKKLVDKTLLVKIAKNEPEWNVRKMAIKKLTNKTALTELANLLLAEMAAKNDSDDDFKHYVESLAAIEEKFPQILTQHHAQLKQWTETIRGK